MNGELVVDERGRTSLARVRSHNYDRYTVEEFPDGTLVLTPAITISPLELAALRDPAVMAAVAEAKTGDRSALRRRSAPGDQEDLRSGRRRCLGPVHAIVRVARGRSGGGPSPDPAAGHRRAAAQST